MISVWFLLLLFGLTNAYNYSDLINDEWTTFKLEHGKDYANAEEDNMRLKIFIENKRLIAEHNQLYNTGEVSYALALNEYADWLPEEYEERLMGTQSTDDFSASDTFATFITPENFMAPKSIDWRQKGAVTEVKSQGRCGSCWAFSTTGSLEGQHFRKTGKLVSLSEQNLVDCSRKYGNNGCKGGTVSRAFKYIIKNHGIDTEKSYPYSGNDGKCKFNKKSIGATAKNYARVHKGDESKLLNAVGSAGPISVAIDASLPTFKLYSHGVYDDAKCSKGNRNHAVLIVGYGTESNGANYWIVKNSWRSSWGDKGYIKMIRGKNICGIAEAAVYPIV